MSKLLIIDTYGLIFRAYYVHPELSTADGVPTGAIYGFLQMLLTSIEKIDPDYIVCSLESETPTFRHQLAEDYKGNRKAPEVDLKSQIVDVINILNSLNLKTLYSEGYEADDVIGSFAKKNEDKFDEIKIITGDRDLLQLLSPKIKVLMPGRFFSDLIEYDREKFEERFNIKLEDFVLYKSLIGDSSDNIKGIPGVGPKTAEKIVNEYHSMDSILANLDQLPPRIAESIQENQELWKKFYQLCKIECNLDSPVKPEDTSIAKLNVYKLREFIDKYEFKSMQKRVAKFIDNFESKHGGFGLFDKFEAEDEKVTELRYFLTDKVEYADETLPKQTPELKIDIIKKEAYVLYSNNLIRIGNGKEFVEIDENELFNFVINQNIKTFIGFELKFFIRKLLEKGIEKLENYEFYDIKLAWHLIRNDISFEGVNDLVKYLNEDSLPEIFKKTLSRLVEEENTANPHSEKQLLDLYELERGLQKVLAHMEFSGINCDAEYLKDLEKIYQTEIAKTKKEIFDFVGHEFNPASTKELGHVLFEVLNLPKVRKTKTGYSTDDKTLSQLESLSGIIPLIKRFRLYSKILSTYVVGLQKCIDPDGKIRTNFRQDMVATGRLSSINPNLQNLPATGQVAIDIKKAFKTSDHNKVFLSCDYSQIDLRVMAYESQDPGLVKAFQNDEDIHTATGKVVFDKEELTKEERNFAKTINFGIVYGMEPYGLSQALGIDQKTAKEFIDKYFERFAGVKKYFERIKKQLEEKKYVNTFLGRKRYFNNWNAIGGFQKKILFREAINMPIQGGSSEIIKIAMVKLFSYFRSNNIDCKMLLQIHDELVFEVDKSIDLEDLKQNISKIMTEAYEIGIPMKVSAKEGCDLSFTE